MGKKSVSLKVIAEELGLSITAVSHAIRDLKDVSEETKKIVRNKAIELGYMPNHLAQKGKVDEKPSVAIVITSLSNLYYTIFCSKLISIFETRNEYNYVLLNANYSRKELVKQCILQRIDLIITYEVFDDEAYQLAELNNIKIIHVGLSTTDNKFDAINIDPEGCAKCVCDYFLSNSKNYKYVYVGASIEEDRFVAFNEMMSERCPSAKVKYFNKDAKVEYLVKLLDQGYTNIYFVNDYEAYRMIDKVEKHIGSSLHEKNEDILVIGVDGLRDEIPGLTELASVKYDYDEYAEEVYWLINNRFKHNQSEPVKKVISVSMN